VFCRTDSKTFRLLQQICRRLQAVYHRRTVSRVLAPLLLLLGFGVAFAVNTLGGSMLGFDDHPGQLYRVWHVLTYGPAPWAWDRGWWGGYPELQFYPPGAAYLGALLAWPTQGVLTIETAYHAVVWLAYLLPGVTTLVAVTRLGGSGWLALPGAFVALALTAGITSGVEGGVRVGMLGARLAWALLPLLLATLVPWIDGDRPLPRVVPLLVAAIVLLHPAQLPAALVLLALAVWWRVPRRPRARAALGAVGTAAALTAFWTVPLLARLADTRALAWGTLSLAELARPLPLVLVALVAAGLLDRAPAFPSERVALWWLPAAAGITLVVRLVLEPLDVRFLPADRVVDGAWMALVVGGGLAFARLGPRARPSLAAPVVGLVGVLAAVLLAIPGNTLGLVSRDAVWPRLRSIERGLRLPDFWTALTHLPEGRVLFTRSAVPLVHGTDWWRPHTHATALTPATSGRDIVHGTFTHPSPIAALVYRGDAGRAPIRRLAEQLDGQSLFGEPLAGLDPVRFVARTERLGVVAVVALEDDLPQLAWLPESTPFRRRIALAPFVLFVRETGVPIPTGHSTTAWSITLAGETGAWTAARLAYYPLWRAEADGARLERRRGADGVLEVRLTQPQQTVTLHYGAGAPELLGVALSIAALAGCAAAAWKSA
jgi:hypothetical protein